MSQVRFAGIDVSAKKLAVCYEPRFGKPPLALEVPNTYQGHLELCRKLSRPASPIRVCLEATGNYSLDVAIALHHHGLEVMIVNPRTARDFGKALQNRSKTDSLDAQVLLEYARRMKFQPWKPPAAELLQLRDISRRIKALTKQATQEKNRLAASSSCQGLSPAVRKDIENHLRHLDRSIEKLLKHAVELIGKHQELSEISERLISIKGIAQASAVHLMAELLLLPDDMTSRQWVAYAGLDPKHHESGSSVQSRPASRAPATLSYESPSSCLPWWPFSTNLMSKPSTRSCRGEEKRPCRPSSLSCASSSIPSTGCSRTGRTSKVKNSSP